MGKPLTCRLFGHDFGFEAVGRTVRWECVRCGAVGGEKAYADEAQARHYAAAFDRRPRGPANVLAALGGRVDRERRRH